MPMAQKRIWGAFFFFFFFLGGGENLKTDLWSQIIRIMAHQRNWRIHSGQGFVGSFDAPWSEWFEITNPFLDSPKKTHPWLHLLASKFLLETTVEQYLIPNDQVKLVTILSGCLYQAGSQKKHHRHLFQWYKILSIQFKSSRMMLNVLTVT